MLAPAQAGGRCTNAAPESSNHSAGGTLGIFLAVALQRKGFKVVVVERGVLKGRATRSVTLAMNHP